MKQLSILTEIYLNTGKLKDYIFNTKGSHCCICFLLIRTSGGVKKNGSTITAPTVMWVKALDLLMDQLKITGLDFQDISAISGAGQVCFKHKL